jgi:NADP-dependent aldehyde dehydrogenase
MPSGSNLIGNLSSREGSTTFRSFDSQNYRELPIEFFEASDEEIERACLLADLAYTDLRCVSKNKISLFLMAVKAELEISRTEILSYYLLESGLSEERAVLEFTRTTNLLNDYAQFLCSPEFSENISESGEPTLVKRHFGIGPVAVFGASNFPLAYSTAGGDTVSAWVARCPVIVKSHPMHACTSELVGRAIQRAAIHCGMPEGIFSLLNGRSHSVGEKLVQHPLIKAVGFTGSHKGGRALFDLAAKRMEPVPVFAEMGSVNPVILADSSKNQLIDQARVLGKSISNDAGQFCTKPGIIFIPEECIEFFIAELQHQLQKAVPSVMLHPEIYTRYFERLDEVARANNGNQWRHHSSKHPLSAVVSVTKVSMNVFMQHRTFHEEVFGPHVLIVGYTFEKELIEALKLLGGQLTISVFCSDLDKLKQMSLLNVIPTMAGRIIWNGVPTGVKVSRASNHGGPYPASTDSRFTAVGFDSWKRFSRDVTFQNFPLDYL